MSWKLFILISKIKQAKIQIIIMKLFTDDNFLRLKITNWKYNTKKGQMKIKKNITLKFLACW